MKIRQSIIILIAILLIGGLFLRYRHLHEQPKYPIPNIPLPSGTRADRILVLKARRELILYKDGKKLKTYRVCLGRRPVGPKAQLGDRKTPEGMYTIDYRNPKSHNHLALHISYPSPRERAYARKRGVDPGGNIMIHGVPHNDHTWKNQERGMDWTSGCIAVTNKEIEELWRVVPNGIPIEIRP